MSSRDISVPPPSTEVISQAEFTCQSTTHKSADVSDQVGRTTPVCRYTPSQATIAALDKHLKTASEIPQVNTSVSRLVPPVGQKPMNSPARIPSDSSLAVSHLQQERHKLLECHPSDAPGLAPPVSHKFMGTPMVPFSSEASTDDDISVQPYMNTTSQPATRAAYDTSRPTCSINLVCYRGGSGGCISRQVQTALRSRFSSEEAFQKTIEKDPQLIFADAVFFRELCRLYWDMSGFWRRYFSLKTLRGLRILAVCY
jgi:hypothetical protein